MQPVEEHVDRETARSEQARRERAEDTAWTVAGRLYRGRWVIAACTVVTAILAVVISLLLPNWYQASARVLVPESQGGSLSSAILGNLPSAASALFGAGPTGDYARYLTVLTSRSMMEAAVDSFDLVSVYETADDEHPRDAAVRSLRDNADFEIDMEFDFLSVSVLDKDPQRAADMANFFVRRLNIMNARLSTEGAANYRRSVERRYEAARTAMDSVLNATQRFQRQHGVYDLPAQTQSFFEQLGELRQSGIEAEIQYEALRAQFGADNAQVRAMQEVAQVADRKYREALAGQEQLLPVPQSEVPSVAREYAELQMEGTIQRSILEVLGPLYEQARFQEERDSQAVQVVDAAVAPPRKAKPKRSVICILATLSAFLLAVGFVLVYQWWQANHIRFFERLQGTSA